MTRRLSSSKLHSSNVTLLGEVSNGPIVHGDALPCRSVMAAMEQQFAGTLQEQEQEHVAVIVIYCYNLLE